MAEAITTTAAADTAAGVLAVARDARSAANQAEATLLQAAVDWAAMHSTDSIDDAAAIWHPSCGEHGVPIAGEGAPLIAEFSVAEFAAAIGQSTDAGRCYLGEAVELRYRLPRTWARVVAGDLVAWKARRIAKTTMTLSLEAAGFVDRHVAGVAHRIGPAQLDRLVLDAVGWFMPAEAERRRVAAAESRCFEVARNQADLSGLSGTTQVWGTLDVADALDLDAAVTAGAAALEGPRLDRLPRRAPRRRPRRHRPPTGDPRPHRHRHRRRAGRVGTSAPTTNGRKPGREVVLYVHLSEAALTGEAGVGRCENTRMPVTTGQIRDWCSVPDTTKITVRPVIDLHDHVHVDAYEVPDRIAEAAALVDHTCVFPWCTRPARKCDCDHCVPHGAGGATCTANIAPLCRRHHRLKTHGGWRYTVIERGSYHWTSPQRYTYLRDHDGTRDVTRDQPTGPGPAEHRRP